MDHDKAVEALRLIDRAIELSEQKTKLLRELKATIQAEVKRTRPVNAPTFRRPQGRVE